VVCWRENEAAHNDDRVERLLGVKTSPWEQGPSFDFVRTSRMIVVRETREAKRTTCWSGSSPIGCTLIQIAVTLSNMSDCLSLMSFHSMSYCIDDMD
jgi:hypothetical protein